MRKLHVEFDFPLDMKAAKAWDSKPEMVEANMNFSFSQLIGTDIENLRVTEMTDTPSDSNN